MFFWKLEFLVEFLLLILGPGWNWMSLSGYVCSMNKVYCLLAVVNELLETFAKRPNMMTIYSSLTNSISDSAACFPCCFGFPSDTWLSGEFSRVQNFSCQLPNRPLNSRSISFSPLCRRGTGHYYFISKCLYCQYQWLGERNLKQVFKEEVRWAVLFPSLSCRQNKS